MSRMQNRTQGYTAGGVGGVTPPGGPRLVMGAQVGAGGSFGLKHPFGDGLSDPVTWSWIWFAVALGIVFGFPYIFRAGPVSLEV